MYVVLYDKSPRRNIEKEEKKKESELVNIRDLLNNHYDDYCFKKRK